MTTSPAPAAPALAHPAPAPGVAVTEVDIVCVGGGPAGLTAALYGARAKHRVVLVERGACGGALLLTHVIENYPGCPNVEGHALAANMEAQAREAGATIVTSAVQRVAPAPTWTPERPRWRVETELAGTFEAPCVILAAGGDHIHLGVPGEDAFQGRGVSYCAVCDCRFTRGCTVVCVGGGDSAFQESELLSQYADRVVLVHRRDIFRASATLVERIRQNPKIELITDAVVTRIEGDEQGVARVVLQGTRRDDGAYDFDGVGPERVVPAQYVFPFLGFTPNSGLVTLPRDRPDLAHLAHAETGHFVTDGQNETSLPGLYAVGDLRAQSVRQVTTAVGDGTVAALACSHRINALAGAP